MTNVGVICEGSHDFCYLKPIIESLLIARGHTVGRIDALQPRVDASSRQVDGGGYQIVQQWLISNKQAGLQKLFGGGLFESSNTYDAIVVHLDGDIPEISVEYAASTYPKTFNTVADRVSAIKSWINFLVKPGHIYASNIIAAVPVFQTEAWVLAGLGSKSNQLESRNWKGVAKYILRMRFSGKAIDQVVQAANAAVPQISSMRISAASFNSFVEEFCNRF